MSRLEQVKERHHLPDTKLETLKEYAGQLLGREVEVETTKNKKFVCNYTNFNMRGIMKQLIADTPEDAYANLITLLSATQAAREEQDTTLSEEARILKGGTDEDNT